MAERLIDPDCKDRFKHGSCAGGPCECPHHDPGLYVAGDRVIVNSGVTWCSQNIGGFAGVIVDVTDYRPATDDVVLAVDVAGFQRALLGSDDVVPDLS